MITVTFKNVGQGDSIIIEYENNGTPKIIVIDCNKAFGTNPVLEHIQAKGYIQLDLLILTHPHHDHYSGFIELITHCIDNKLPIKYFLHTSNPLPEFWHNTVIAGTAASNELGALLSLLRKARKDIGMDFHPLQGDGPMSEIDLFDDVKLKFLAPSSEEVDKYALNQSETAIEDEEPGNNSKANILSTMIKLYRPGVWCVLLTADLDKTVLRYWGIKRKDDFKEKLVLAQSPHHGSKYNHVGNFWKNMNRDKETPIVFSVGVNTHGHPAKEVIESFSKLNYRIMSTNSVGPLSRTTATSTITSVALTPFAAVPAKPRSNYDGDKIFTIDVDGMVTIL